MFATEAATTKLVSDSHQPLENAADESYMISFVALAWVWCLLNWLGSCGTAIITSLLLRAGSLVTSVTFHPPDLCIHLFWLILH